MSTTTPPDRDVYNLLVELNGIVRETASKVNSMHSELLGENGHISRIDDHIDRLYKRTEDLREKDTELEKQIGVAALPAGNFIERLKGGWGLVIAIALVLDIAAHVLAFTKGLH